MDQSNLTVWGIPRHDIGRLGVRTVKQIYAWAEPCLRNYLTTRIMGSASGERERRLAWAAWIDARPCRSEMSRSAGEEPVSGSEIVSKWVAESSLHNSVSAGRKKCRELIATY